MAEGSQAACLPMAPPGLVVTRGLLSEWSPGEAETATNMASLHIFGLVPPPIKWMVALGVPWVGTSGICPGQTHRLCPSLGRKFRHPVAM